MNIQSILRHWFTLAATALTGWLVLPPEQQAELQNAFGELVGPVGIILTLVVAAAWRLAIAWLGRMIGHGSGESGGKMNLLVLGFGLTAALGMALPSCTASQLEAARAIPIKGCVLTDQGMVSYSTKSGLSYEVDTRSGK